MEKTVQYDEDEFRGLIKEMRLPYLRYSVTPDCNADCKFCHNEGVQHGARGDNAITVPSTLASSDVEYVARFFKQHFKKVALTGGEPTLAANIGGITRIFAQHGYRVHMTTNGFMFDEAMQKELSSAGLSHVNVSLHSLDEKDYDNVFGVAGNLPKVLKNLETVDLYFPERAKINFMALPKVNIPDQLVPISELSARTGITISYLAVVKERDVSNPLSKQVVDFLSASLGIKSIKEYGDKFGSRYIYTLSNGAKWEVDDFRTQAYVKDAFNNAVCQACNKRKLCTEGPYALRITHKGSAKPCLIRNDNILRLKNHEYDFKK